MKPSKNPAKKPFKYNRKVGLSQLLLYITIQFVL